MVETILEGFMQLTGIMLLSDMQLSDTHCITFNLLDPAGTPKTNDGLTGGPVVNSSLWPSGLYECDMDYNSQPDSSHKP